MMQKSASATPKKAMKERSDERLAKEEQESSRKRSLSSDEDEDDSEEDDVDVGKGDGSKPDVTKARREKRLAMNRASARARRKRKKVLLDSLANQVTDLTKRNQTLQLNNDAMRARVDQLESALAQAQSTITSLVAEMRSPLQHQLGGLSALGGGQDSIRSLLLGAAPTAGALGDPLLAAHLLGRPASALHARAGLSHLGGLQHLQSDVLGSSAGGTPISSYLGQTRVS